MEFKYWKNNSGDYPAKDEVGSLDKWMQECLVKRLKIVAKYSFLQATRANILEKLKGVAERLKLWEIKLSLPKQEGRLLGVLDGNAVYLVVFFIKKKQKIPDRYKRLAEERAAELWGQDNKTGISPFS